MRAYIAGLTQIASVFEENEKRTDKIYDFIEEVTMDLKCIKIEGCPTQDAMKIIVSIAKLSECLKIFELPNLTIEDEECES
jgi:hypothetical protein